ncbi:helix-hairpin-helix domain-containing protein [Streptomyces purpureus]|uniref:helix-hairpin-helix domain-containing protein n=1 Tax=Streptomyces purpureus TaxID=1951 RepID=UPI003CC7F47B
MSRRRAEALFASQVRTPAAAGTPTVTTAPVVPRGPEVPVGAPGGQAGARVGERERAGRQERVRLALRERLPLWVRLRCGLEPKSLAALAVVLVVAAGLAARHFWTGRPESVSAPAVVRVEPPPDGPTPSKGPDHAAGPSPSPLVIDVSGKVRRPGVLTLPAGSRVADALRAAGGVRPGTDLTGLNRARVLMDGEQVAVGVPAAAGGPGLPLTTGPGPSAGPVSLSTATVEQLDTLPGVGPVLAQHIVDFRTERGGFQSVDQLREVTGIGDRRFADLKPLVRP